MLRPALIQELIIITITVAWGLCLWPHAEDRGHVQEQSAWRCSASHLKLEQWSWSCGVHRDPHSQIWYSFALEKCRQRGILPSSLHFESSWLGGFSQVPCRKRYGWAQLKQLFNQEPMGWMKVASLNGQPSTDMGHHGGSCPDQQDRAVVLVIPQSCRHTVVPGCRGECPVAGLELEAEKTGKLKARMKRKDRKATG